MQRMTFELSFNMLNYFQIVIFIYTDIVLITQAEAKALSGAVDGELNRAGSPGAWLACLAAARREMTSSL